MLGCSVRHPAHPPALPLVSPNPAQERLLPAAYDAAARWLLPPPPRPGAPPPPPPALPAVCRLLDRLLPLAQPGVGMEASAPAFPSTSSSSATSASSSSSSSASSVCVPLPAALWLAVYRSTFRTMQLRMQQAAVAAERAAAGRAGAVGAGAQHRHRGAGQRQRLAIDSTTAGDSGPEAGAAKAGARSSAAGRAQPLSPLSPLPLSRPLLPAAQLVGLAYSLARHPPPQPPPQRWMRLLMQVCVRMCVCARVCAARGVCLMVQGKYGMTSSLSLTPPAPLRPHSGAPTRARCSIAPPESCNLTPRPSPPLVFASPSPLLHWV